jgi:hypothetical protein
MHSTVRVGPHTGRRRLDPEQARIEIDHGNVRPNEAQQPDTQPERRPLEIPGEDLLVTANELAPPDIEAAVAISEGTVQAIPPRIRTRVTAMPRRHELAQELLDRSILGCHWHVHAPNVV